MAVSDNALELESKTFEAMRGELCETHLNRWVLIKGDRLIKIFDSGMDAFQYGVEKFGPDKPFMVRQILAQDPPLFHFASRV